MSFETFAERFVGQYNLFLLALIGKYMMARARRVTAGDIVRFQTDGFALGRAFSDAAKALIEEYASSLTSEPNGDELAVLRVQRQRIDAYVTVAIGEGIETLARALFLSSVTTSINTPGMKALQSKQLDDPQFLLRDSADRRWDARKLMRAVARDFAYQTLIRYQVAEARRTGETQAMVTYPDANHADNGMLFSLENSAAMPTFNDIEASIFHPNSTATVTHVHA